MFKLGLIAFAAALVLAVANLFVPVVSVLLLIFAGILFGIFLNALGRWLAAHSPLSYRWSYAVVVFLLIALIAGGFYYFGSSVAQQSAKLTQQLNTVGTQAADQLKQYGIDPAELKNLIPKSSVAASQLARAAQALLWGITGLIVIFFIGVYTAYDPDLYEKGWMRLVPPDRRARGAEVLHKIRSALGRWMIGRILSMLIIGVATAIGLSVLGVPMAISLGVLAGLLTFIPNIGPVVAAIPQALMAAQVDMNTVLWVIGLNLALQGIESYVVTPMIQRYEVSLPPALTISAQLVLGLMFGIVGLLVAAPLTVAAIILVQMLYIQDRLGDRQLEAGLG